MKRKDPPDASQRKACAELGRMVRQMRDSKGISQDELAARVGAGDKKYISDIETGKRTPSEKILEGLIKVLEFSQAEADLACFLRIRAVNRTTVRAMRAMQQSPWGD